MCLQTKVLVLCCVIVTLSGGFAVYIKENAYKGVTIAFSPSIQGNEINSTKLKNVIQKASKILFLATRKRAFFSEIDFLYPSTYTSACEQETVVKGQPQGISVYVADSKNKNDRNLLRAQHSKGCGAVGEVIYMSPEWLEGDEEELSREFVQQWATYRYGVFEETAEQKAWPCYTNDGKLWIQNGCYSSDISVSLFLDHNGLPSCESVSISDYDNLQSSLMSKVSSSKITDFCDGSKLRPHNPVAPTRHNRICRGRPVWSVIKESEDFRYGRNPPREENFTLPDVSFRCFRESTNYIIFSIQICSKKNIEKSVNDVRLSLLRFLLFEVWPETQVSIVTFHETAETPFHLNLTEPTKVFDQVDNKVRTPSPVSHVCLSCGLRSAFNLSRANEGKNTAVVFMAFVSALKGEDLREFINLLKTSPCRTYLIIIQDEEEDLGVSELIRATKKTGGEVFVAAVFGTNMPSPMLTTSLTIYLASVLTNPLIIQDNVVVIHESSFFNFGGEAFQDTVKAGNVLEGEITYTLTCNDSRVVVNDTVTECSPSLPNVKDVQTEIRCGYTGILTTEKKVREWTFSYYVKSGMDPVMCSSVATVRLKVNSSDLLTVRGWMNTETIEAGQPGRNCLIIYAEVMHNSVPITKARIQAAVRSFNSSTPTMIELLDTGNGDPDIMKGDGIYSRYFTHLNNGGIHSVVIYANGNLPSHDATDTSQDGIEFSKIVPAGSFVVTEKPEHLDYYPPNRIGDLRVTHIDHNDSVITLQWTAPGDNYDDGTANGYNMKYSLTMSELEETAFETGNAGSLEKVAQEIHMLPSGQMQNATVLLSPSEENIPYYLAIQSINKNGDVSPVSNIVQIFFEKSARVRTTTTTTTTVMPDTSHDLTTTNESITMEFTDLNNSTVEGITENWGNNSTMEPMTNTTNADNTTGISKTTTDKPVTDGNNDPCDKEFVIILASSIGGGTIILIVIINAIVCSICMRKYNRPKKTSRKASLRPPYNMTVVPREHPDTTSDTATFSGPNGNFREDLQNFDIDPDYTFISGGQLMGNRNHNYHTATTMQTDDAGYTNRSLTRRFNIPQDFADTVPSTLVVDGVHYKRNYSEDDAETSAISLGIV